MIFEMVSKSKSTYKKEILWENSNPNTDYDSGTLFFDLGTFSKYKKIIIEYYDNLTKKNVFELAINVPTDLTTTYYAVLASFRSTTSKGQYLRYLYMLRSSSDDRIYFNSAKYIDSSSQYNSGYYCVPIAIYGVNE